MTQFHSRFTLVGHPLLDDHIKKQLRLLVRFLCEHHVAGDLWGIWLGGSYGRGEGGVLKRGDTEQPFGDYDLYLLYAEGKDTKYLPYYGLWEQTLSRLVKLPVQLRSPGSLRQLYQQAHELRWYDLCQQHQKLWVSPELDMAQQDQTVLPQLSASNSVKLIFGMAGLLLTQTELSPAVFYRCVLNTADSVLITSSCYHPSLQGRLQRMYRLQHELGVSWLRELFYLQQEAARYCTAPAEQLPQTLPTQRLCHLVSRAYIAIYTGVEQQGDRESFAALKLPQLLRQAEILSFLTRSKKQTGLLLYLLPFLLQAQAWKMPTLHQLKPYLSIRLYRQLSRITPAEQQQMLEAYFLEKWMQFQRLLNP